MLISVLTLTSPSFYHQLLALPMFVSSTFITFLPSLIITSHHLFFLVHLSAYMINIGTGSTPSEAAMGESVARILGGKAGKTICHITHLISILIPFLHDTKPYRTDVRRSSSCRSTSALRSMAYSFLCYFLNKDKPYPPSYHHHTHTHTHTPA